MDRLEALAVRREWTEDERHWVIRQLQEAVEAANWTDVMWIASLLDSRY